ncbi:ribonuclease H-like domain-containing protein, partial [Tanacetum coccineum]
MEEIDIRWQVAMITTRIRKFMRKTGRPIDLKPKNGITFDKSKIECFNCQKLGHFARECRFAKYQENRANGRQEKRIVAIEDPNSKALVATDNNEDIDWTKEFDAEPVTFAMMALTELEEDDLALSGTSALVGLATNQKFNFSLMIMNGMLGHISNGTPFLMYPRFIQLFLNKQLEGVTRPQNFLPSVTLPSKVFTFMRKHSPKFSCRITPLTPPMLEVVTALAAEEAHSTSSHSRAETSPRDAQAQGTDDAQGTAAAQGTSDTPKSPNAQAQGTSDDASQTSGGDEGLLDLYALNREVRRLKKQTLSQGKQIHKLKAKLKKLSKFVQPVVKHHAFWVESQDLKKRRKKQRKKVSSVKLGRNKDEGTLSEEHYVQDDHHHTTFVYEDFDATAFVTPDLERKNDETEERKSDETEEVLIEEEK